MVVLLFQRVFIGLVLIWVFEMGW